MESHPPVRLSLASLAGPFGWSGSFISPGFGPLMIRLVGVSSIDSTLPHSVSSSLDLFGWALGITRLWSSGNNPIFFVRWVLPGFGPLATTLSSSDLGFLISPGLGPLMIRLVGVLSTDSTLPHRWLLGITGFWSSGNNLTIVGVSPTGSTLSYRVRSHRPATSLFCWLTPRPTLKYPSASDRERVESVDETPTSRIIRGSKVW